MNFYKRYKLAIRGNIPIMEDRDVQPDPYKKRTPGDGRGVKMTTMGDEETGGSVGGTRARGADFPRFQQFDEYEEQRKKDIPTSNHMFMGEDGEAPIGEGANDDRFEDYRDKMVDVYKGKEPVGPHNMQTFRSVIERTRSRLKGE